VGDFGEHLKRKPGAINHSRRTCSAGLSSQSRRKPGAVVFLVHVLISHSFVNLRAIITHTKPSDQNMRAKNGAE
jgi:hypothetical protein